MFIRRATNSLNTAKYCFRENFDNFLLGANILRFFVYSRKSICGERGESVENQVEMCRRYIRDKFPEEKNPEISVYEDEGFSAKNTERPRFRQMLRDLRKENPDFVICYRLDRISRNVSDFSALIEELNGRGISFICIKEEFDTSKPMGKAMMYIASVFAQLERETIAERVRDNMLMLARNGRWLGGTTPTGFVSERVTKVSDDGRVKTYFSLRENISELNTVAVIYEKFLECRCFAGVYKFLTARGIQSRTGSDYSLPGIKQILQNPVYCAADEVAFDYFTALGCDVCFKRDDCSDKYGLFAYNKRDCKKKLSRQPVNKWIISKGSHKGLISGEKWTKVQKIIGSGGEKTSVSKERNDYSLFSGLIFCAQCGNRMFSKRRSGKSSRREQYDYICKGKLLGGEGGCRSLNLTGRRTDEAVYASILNLIYENSGICKLLEKMIRGFRKERGEDRISIIESRIKQYDLEIKNLLDSLSKAKTEEGFVKMVNARITELDAEISSLSEEKSRLEIEEKSFENECFDIFSERLSDLKNCNEIMSVFEKRELMRIIVDKIVWDGENLHVFMKYQ